MADFFEIEYLKKDYDTGKICTRYIYLNINHLLYWEYEQNDPDFGEVFRYRLPGFTICVSKKFHIKFKAALIASTHKIKYSINS